MSGFAGAGFTGQGWQGRAWTLEGRVCRAGFVGQDLEGRVCRTGWAGAGFAGQVLQGSVCKTDLAEQSLQCAEQGVQGRVCRIAQQVRLVSPAIHACVVAGVYLSHCR